MLRVMEREGWLYVSGSVDGTRIMKSTRLRKGFEREAELMRVKIEGELLHKAKAAHSGEATFGQIAKAYQQWREMEGRTGRGDWYAIKLFRERWEDRLPKEIKAAEIQELVAEEFDEIKPGTVRRYLKMLRAVCNHGLKMGMCTAVPKVPMPRVDDARDVHLNLDEIEAMLGWVMAHRPALYVAFVVLVDTGVRLGELLALEYRDVRDGEMHVRKKDHGKSKGRTVPLSERAQRAIEGSRGAPGAPVYNDSGRPFESGYRARRLLAVALDEACAAIGAPRLRVHDLRHTFAYQAAMHGADLGDLQQLLGHRTLAMTLRYRGYIKSRASSVVGAFGRVRKSCDESVMAAVA